MKQEKIFTNKLNLLNIKSALGDALKKVPFEKPSKALLQLKSLQQKYADEPNEAFHLALIEKQIARLEELIGYEAQIHALSQTRREKISVSSGSAGALRKLKQKKMRKRTL